MRKQREFVDTFFYRHRIGFKVLMKMASKTDKWKRERPLARIENSLSL